MLLNGPGTRNSTVDERRYLGDESRESAFTSARHK